MTASLIITPCVYYNQVNNIGRNTVALSSEMTPTEQSIYTTRAAQDKKGKSVFASASMWPSSNTTHRSIVGVMHQYEYTLYLGFNSPDGCVVSWAEFNDFCICCVDDRFQGYSIRQGEGVWKGEREDCVVMTFIGTSDDAELVRTIARDYKFCFDQESVLYTSRKLDDVEFI